MIIPVCPDAPGGSPQSFWRLHLHRWEHPWPSREGHYLLFFNNHDDYEDDDHHHDLGGDVNGGCQARNAPHHPSQDLSWWHRPLHWSKIIPIAHATMHLWCRFSLISPNPQTHCDGSHIDRHWTWSEKENIAKFSFQCFSKKLPVHKSCFLRFWILQQILQSASFGSKTTKCTFLSWESSPPFVLATFFRENPNSETFFKIFTSGATGRDVPSHWGVPGEQSAQYFSRRRKRLKKLD